MKHFGFERFAVVGHDRGGRVAHRLTLDHPDKVTKVAVLDIVPTRTVFKSVNKPGGHTLQESAPNEMLAELQAFLVA